MIRREDIGAGDPAAGERRAGRRVPPRRPWLLIAAALLLALLSSVLWIKWKDSRGRAEQLAAELKKVYAEAETLRMEAALAKQRIGQLEQQLRALQAERGKPANSSKEPKPRGR